MNNHQRKKENTALSKDFLEPRSIPDKDTQIERRSLGVLTLNCGNHVGDILG